MGVAEVMAGIAPARWRSVIRIWALAPGKEEYVYQYDPQNPMIQSPEMIVATLRSLADDIERVAKLGEK